MYGLRVVAVSGGLSVIPNTFTIASLDTVLEIFEGGGKSTIRKMVPDDGGVVPSAIWRV